MYRAIFLAASVAAIIVAPAAHAAGNAQHGQQLFVVCQACHTVAKGGGNSVGPNLFGIAGHKAASVPGFSYSNALKSANITWTNDKLKSWVMNPQKMVPGTRMTFAGFSDPAKADDIVAYLDSLK